MRIAFFEVEEWERAYIEKKLPAGVSASFFATPMQDAPLSQNDFDAISLFVGSAFTDAELQKFPNLKLVTTRSTGFDHIDIVACRERGIQVGYAPGYGDNTVAEFTFGLLLALSRRLYDAVHRIRETGEFSFEGLRGFDLKGKTIGVIGTGRIGCEVLRIARGFEMNAIACDAHPRLDVAAALPFSYVPLDDLLAQSDVITLHVPYSAATHHLINGENISKIKRGAILINTSRGAVVETAALVAALRQGLLGGAGLDVLEEEGLVRDEKELVSGRLDAEKLRTVLGDHVLMEMPNVMVTPHMAFNTTEAIERILDADIENMKSFAETGIVKYSVPDP